METDQHVDTHVIGWRRSELLQSLCVDYFGPHPADDGIDESRNGQWQVSPVGVDDAHREIAAHVLRQYGHQPAGREIGCPQYRCQRDAEARYRRLSDRLRGIRHHAAGDGHLLLGVVGTLKAPGRIVPGLWRKQTVMTGEILQCGWRPARG